MGPKMSAPMQMKGTCGIIKDAIPTSVNRRPSATSLPFVTTPLGDITREGHKGIRGLAARSRAAGPAQR